MKKNTTDTTYINDLAQIMNDHNLAKINIINAEDYAEVTLEKVLEQNQTATKMHISHEDIMEGSKYSASPDADMDIHDITSPMVAVLYTASSPTAPPFVQIGDVVKKGTVLCVLEAMKVMNELQAEEDGKIIDICVKNGDVVEFGQTLFRIEPL